MLVADEKFSTILVRHNSLSLAGRTRSQPFTVHVFRPGLFVVFKKCGKI
jgi:hypothetical protein